MAKKEIQKKEKQNKLAALEGLGGYPKGYIRNRVLATIVDFLIITLLCQYALMLVGAPDWPKYVEMGEVVRGLLRTDPLVVERMALYQQCFILTLAIGGIYEAVTLVLFKASFGKILFKLRVEDINPTRKIVISKLMLILRTAIKVLSIYLVAAMPYIILCLSLFGNTRGQSGFDLFLGTKVVDLRKKEKPETA